MLSELTEDIQASIQDIEHLLHDYQLLIERSKHHMPDQVELAALATVLHSFYNGVEGIFIRIAKSLDDRLTQDGQWHRTLLVLMTTSNTNRACVISLKMAEQLSMYMQFRHFFSACLYFSTTLGSYAAVD